MNVLQGMHIYIYIYIYIYMRNELKTGENESMQENENDLFMDWVPPINKRIKAHRATKTLAHTISMISSKTVIYSKEIS